MKGLASFILILAVLASSAAAYQLVVKVTVGDDTPAIGTNVSLVSGGVELEVKKAVNTTRYMEDAVTTFDVANGSYFVLLRRGGYPLHVSLVDVEGNTGVTLTMRQFVSYANAYGQITGPTDFSNASISAYSNGKIAKRAVPNKNGYYTLSFIPEGTYDVVFEAQGFNSATKTLFLPTADFTEVNAYLVKPAPKPVSPPAMTVPAQVQKLSVIEVRLVEAGSPLPGAKVSVETPSGKITITTGADGIARIHAAEPGTYTFAYKNLSYSTKVLGSAAPASPSKQPAPPEQQPIEQPTAQQGGASPLVMAAVLFAVSAVIGLILIVIAIRIFMPLLRKGKPLAKKEGHETKHIHHKKK